MTTASRVPRVALAFSYALVPALLLVVVWYPTWQHYRRPAIAITETMLEGARTSPPDAVLDELAQLGYLEMKWRDKQHLLQAADRLLRGDVDLPNMTAPAITIPFAAADLDRGSVTWQLIQAGLGVPHVFLRAFAVSGRDEFLFAARDVIMGWAEYERQAWLPRGLLWNDHALTSRVAVLAEFWRAYRRRSDFDPLVARPVLAFAARSAALLAKPGHFTFATNHGIMQNLGLWHFAVAFPTLGNAAAYTALATTRMDDQLAFYLDARGVVLEHSAGYQAFGLELMRRALRYLALAGQPVPPTWSSRYAGVQRVYAQLRRPDGSLPMVGDTDGSVSPLGSFTAGVEAAHTSRPYEPTALYATAGYAVWWDGLERWPDARALRHTVVAWSHFPGHAHKHADEMSVLLWAGGQTWWTNSGYWPYGDVARAAAESWGGSNAPHLVDEPYDSPRDTHLLGHSASQHLAVIDLQRIGPSGYVARRQVVHWKPDVWLVLDHTTDPHHRRTTTTWTAFPGLRMREDAEHVYGFEGDHTSLRLDMAFVGATGMAITPALGRLTPFAGWAVIDVPIPAPALVVEQPADNGWSVLIARIRERRDSTAVPIDRAHVRWRGPRDWSVILPTGSGPAEIRRDDRHIALVHERRSHDETELLTPTPPSVDSGERDRIVANYRAAAQRYQKFPERVPFRLKLTKLLIFGFLLQELGFGLYQRLWGTGYGVLRFLSLGAWAGGGIWVYLTYLRPA